MSLDKMLYDDYFCLVASIKQQIHWKEVKEATRKRWKSATPKRMRVQKKKDATNNNNNHNWAHV